MEPKLKFRYFSLYLKRQLFEEGEVRWKDNAWLNERGDAAAAEFEASRRQGLTVEERQGDTGNLSYKDFSQFKIVQL